MIKITFCRIILIGSLLITGCSSFILDADSEKISLKYQAGEYVLLSDLNRNDRIFPKDSIVKLIVVTSDEWVKIYVYNSSEELLESTRLLLLYMFEDDFPDQKFSQEYFEAELLKLVRHKDSSEKPEKATKKKKNKK